jgi:hypothetical protein
MPKHDWHTAVAHVQELIDDQFDLLGEPVFSMTEVTRLNALLVRYVNGERSAALYKAMLEAD